MSEATALAPESILPRLQAAARALATANAGASALMGLLVDPDVDLDLVLAELDRDPALAARVLKVANSPFYGRAGQIGTVRHAVALLGLTAVRSIAAAGCLDRLTPARGGPAFDGRRFRRHSLAVALATRALARHQGLPIEAEAYMAGLLHDVGVLVLMRAMPEATSRFDRAAAPPEGLDAEYAQLGATHVQAGQLLAEAWQLPGWLVQALAQHHAPAAPARDASPHAALPTLLALADTLAVRCGLGLWPSDGTAGDGALPPGLAPEAVTAVQSGLAAEVDALDA